jgi:hypothetical protein
MRKRLLSPLTRIKRSIMKSTTRKKWPHRLKERIRKKLR